MKRHVFPILFLSSNSYILNAVEQAKLIMEAVRAILAGFFFASKNLMHLGVCTLVCFFLSFSRPTIFLRKHSQVRMSIEYGILPLSAETFLAYAWTVCIALKEDLYQALEWSHLSMLLVKKFHAHIKLSNRGRVWFFYCSICLFFLLKK